MADNAKTCVDDWISENVRATGFEPETDQAEAKRLAVECWRHTDRSNFSRAQVDAAVGDLVRYMAAAIERVNMEEVHRLANKPPK